MDSKLKSSVATLSYCDIMVVSNWAHDISNKKHTISWAPGCNRTWAPGCNRIAGGRKPVDGATYCTSESSLMASFKTLLGGMVATAGPSTPNPVTKLPSPEMPAGHVHWVIREPNFVQAHARTKDGHIVNLATKEDFCWFRFLEMCPQHP